VSEIRRRYPAAAAESTDDPAGIARRVHDVGRDGRAYEENAW